ncbi:MAG TPA: 4-hydroxythreonine-4-phosphate dehydrogenase, partial [Hyphomicrobiaceae bacterium]|nr:4-hydroxythreonine-4-phosphate dehydrogenase [Hyphomicrobiaceae bacterium]
MSRSRRALALTLGDPSGLGPDITIAAWQQRHTHGIAPFVAIGARQALVERAGALGLAIPIEAVTDPGAALACFDRSLPV